MINAALTWRVIEKGLKENLNGREVVMYGKNKEVQKEIEKAGFMVEKIFTGNPKLFSDGMLNCIDYREMMGKSDKYYVVIAVLLKDGEFQRKVMKKYGYEEYKDYIFYSIAAKDISLDSPCIHEDDGGNHIEIRSKNVKVKILQGMLNQIHIEDGVVVNGNLTIVIRGCNNKIEIKKNSKFVNRNVIQIGGGNTCLRIEENSRFTESKISLSVGCSMKVGKKCTFGRNARFYLQRFSKLLIEDDAMFSFDILIQMGDGHSIFDLNTEKNINSDRTFLEDGQYLSEIHINRHVWVGREAMIVSGFGETKIGEGSIIGTRSFVKGKFPNNCTIVGIPAKVGKKDVAWSRKYMSDNIEDCGEFVKPTKE